jgi:multidrug efflux pump subunit AcrA (membrane-fusion protein)
MRQDNMKTLDSRDLMKRLDELQDLQSDIETAREAVEEAQSALIEAEAHLSTTRDRADDERKALDDAEDDDDAQRAVDDAKEALDDAKADLESAESNFTQDERQELAELEELESEVSEWRYGATLIPESDFTDYCRELLVDCGDLPSDLPSYVVIDWEATADNLRADYSEGEYNGTTYLFRS